MSATKPTSTWVPTNMAQQTGTAYPLAIDGNFAVATRFVDNFAPHAAPTPNMTIVVDSGHIFSPSNPTLIEVAAQTTTNFTAPNLFPRIDRIVANQQTGIITVVHGVESSSPAAPALPSGSMPIAQVTLQTSTTAISNAMIADERALWGVGGGGGFQTQATIASSATTDLGASGSNNVFVSGNTTIGSFGSTASVAAPVFIVTFGGALTLTNSPHLILPGGVNQVVQPNDSLIANYLGSGNWQVLGYFASAQATTVYQNAVNVKAYGAIGDGVADDTTSLTNALAAAKDIFIPAGTYKINGGLTVRLGQHISGAGRDCCTIEQHASGVTVFSCIQGGPATPPQGGPVVSSLIENMTIKGAVANVRGVFTQLCSDFAVKNVLFRGCASGAVEYDRGYYNLIDACTSRPTATFKAGSFSAESLDDTNYIFSPIFRNLVVDAGDQEFGLLTTPGVNTRCIHFRRVISGFIQDFSGSRLNYPTANAVDGIVMENDCQGCKIQGGVTFGAKIGIAAVPGPGVTAAPSYFTITDFDCDQFSTAGIVINGNGSVNCLDANISRCMLTAPQGGAVCITASFVLRGIISDNILDQYGAQGGVGINLANTNSVNIVGNQLANFTFGLDLTAPTITTICESNLITNCATAITGTGIAGTNNTFRHNEGWNPFPTGVAAPAVPASGAGTQNQTAHDVIIAITGGTNVVWGMNGIPSNQAGTSAGITFFCPAWSTILLSYSTAPTWVWIGI